MDRLRRKPVILPIIKKREGREGGGKEFASRHSRALSLCLEGGKKKKKKRRKERKKEFSSTQFVFSGRRKKRDSAGYGNLHEKRGEEGGGKRGGERGAMEDLKKVPVWEKGGKRGGKGGGGEARVCHQGMDSTSILLRRKGGKGGKGEED